MKSLSKMSIGRKAVMMVAATAVAMGSATVVSAPNAAAAGGNEDPSNGIVWGKGQNGGYMVPLQSGGEKLGWCIDPGAAYPKQAGNYGGTQYGEKQKWEVNMTPKDKRRIAIALALGTTVEKGGGSAIKVLNDIKDKLLHTEMPSLDKLGGILEGLLGGNLGNLGNLDFSKITDLLGNIDLGSILGSLGNLIPKGAEVKSADVQSVLPVLSQPQAGEIAEFINDNRDTLDKKVPVERDGSNVKVKAADVTVADIIGEDELEAQVKSKKTIAETFPTLSKGIDTLASADGDAIAAAVADTVHAVGGNYPEGNKPSATQPWSESRVGPGAEKIIYDLINTASSIPLELIPLKGIIPSVDFGIRSQADGSNKRQRMVVVQDVKVDFNKSFELPKFPSPPGTTPPGDTPGTTPGTTPGPNPPGSTPPGSTTPGVPVTESTTTPASSSSTTTPGKDKDKPEVRTSAGTKSENIVEQGKTITDTVTYKNLEKGKEYRLTGETVDKESGKKDGNKGEITFKPKTPNGRIDVPIKIEKVSSDQLVVFETLEQKIDGKWKKVAEHADTDDQAQTVGRLPRKPDISTTAESSTGNNIQTGTTVNDTVRFQGLTPGKNYRLEARLMCKADGSDTGAVANHEFTPEQENGQTVVQNIEVTNPDCFKQVVFEKLYDDKGFLVASHEDINDAAQTFGGDQPAKKKKKTPVAEKPAPKPAKPVKNPAPIAMANAEAHPAPAPAPQGIGGGGGAPAPAPRQVIGSVPSGDFTNNGSTLFTR